MRRPGIASSLLTRFGKQARDHFSLLSKLSSGEEGLWADAFVDEYQDKLLAKIQSDILYLLEPENTSIRSNPTMIRYRFMSVIPHCASWKF